ncbi:uncharacterized protein LOC111379109 [Olea europaea var. sylvestris]|uniref:uncharacterized protein LOC111379109 n=1 Tax=Olea europaea var. sylvestris TaxID=158386 RepID=UPI000C1D41DF|nr:uncharacterized protein LOC111379109 [Olea europaea var. sylvestris]
MSLTHPGDTIWGSHLKTMTRFISMFNAIIDTTFHKLYKKKKNQDIQNAMMLLKLYKYALQNTRDNSWDTLLSKVTYYHHFYVDLYSYAIDLILQKLNDRFLETTTKIFTCISCLSPRYLFAAFDVCKLVRLAQLYPLDFNNEELLLLKPQLDKFLILVRMDEDFFNLKSISCIAQKLVETGNSSYFLLIYRLITLVLILPVATASVERVFYAMNLIKNDLRNEMGDELLNDSLELILGFLFSDVMQDYPFGRFLESLESLVLSGNANLYACASISNAAIGLVLTKKTCPTLPRRATDEAPP